MSNIVVKEATEVARPLKVLVPLIKADFEQAEKAGQPFYNAAGEKLLEAQKGHFEDDQVGFYKWAVETFQKTKDTIRLCVIRAGLTNPKSFKSNKEVRYAPKKQGGLGHIRPVSRSWTAPVDIIAERARREAQRVAVEDAISAKERREAIQKLAKRIIQIGYRVLAKELHSDRGGSDKSMQLLGDAKRLLEGALR